MLYPGVLWLLFVVVVCDMVSDVIVVEVITVLLRREMGGELEVVASCDSFEGSVN